ncbi:MAG: DUF2304 domain-containing protein [Pseudomonadota bacterium]
MIAQFILSAGLLVCLFYIVSLGKSSVFFRVGFFFTVIGGFVAIWSPDTTSVVAKLVGIGRGADLIIYLWILLSLFLILKLHIKLRSQSETITSLARHIALKEAD